MKLEIEQGNGYQIERIDSHNVTINNTVYSHSIIVMPKSIIDWNVERFDALNVAHFEKLCALRPEVVLLGTGQKNRFPSPDLLVPLMNEGIGVEVMDMQAACRTYMILMVEGRKVAAALLFQ
jgi:uncharacterized protein